MTEQKSQPEDDREPAKLPKIAGRSLSELRPSEDTVLAAALRRVIREIGDSENYSAFGSAP